MPFPSKHRLDRWSMLAILATGCAVHEHDLTLYGSDAQPTGAGGASGSSTQSTSTSGRGGVAGSAGNVGLGGGGLAGSTDGGGRAGSAGTFDAGFDASDAIADRFDGVAD